MDSLLVGRIDGSLAVVEVFDRCSFNRLELQHCHREAGTSPLFPGVVRVLTTATQCSS